jgi:hypothetical protein
LNDIDRQICVCSEQFDRLLRAGAYDTRPPSEESQGEANILLRRATELGRHVVALRMVRIKEAEVLAKVTGHVGNRDPMPEATLGFE